jgi:hypothetical protein
MKINVEWKEQDGVWKSVKAEAAPTRNNNLKISHAGTVLVFQNLKEGTHVLSPDGHGKWKTVGRVTRYGGVFLGDGKTHAETTQENFQNKRWEAPIFG